MDKQNQLDRFQGFLEQDPNNATLLCDIANLQFSLSQFTQARVSAEKASLLAPKKAEAQTLLGLTAAQELNYALAADHLTKALELGETAPVALYNHAYSLFMLGDYAKAEPSAATAAQHDDEIPNAPGLYIRILHYLGKVDEAIQYAEGLAAAGKTPPLVSGMLSTLYLDADQMEKARLAAATALGQDASDTDARNTMGVIALSDLDSKLAMAHFTQVLTKQSNNGRALLGKGLSELLDEDIDTAAATLEQTVKTSNMGGHVGTWHTLAWCHILKKNVEAADQALQKALELDRNFAETHGGLAIVALMRGNIDSAVQAVKRANALDRMNFSGNFAQSLIQQVSGNATKARAIVDGLLGTALLPGGKTLQIAAAEMLARREGKSNKNYSPQN